MTMVACLHSSDCCFNGMKGVLRPRQFQSTNARGKHDNAQTIQLWTSVNVFSNGTLENTFVWPWLGSGLEVAHPLDSVLPPVFTSARTKKVYSSSWCRDPSPLWRRLEADRCLAACLRLQNCCRSISNCNNPYCCTLNSPAHVQGPTEVAPPPRSARLSSPFSKHLGLGVLGEGPGRQHPAGGLEESPAGRGPPRSRPGRRGAGGARGRAGPRVRSGRAAGTRRCAPRLNEPGLPARATLREPAAGAGAASFPPRGGRRRPSGSRLGGLRRCARCREAAASGDGDRAEASRRAVTAAPPPQALSERRRWGPWPWSSSARSSKVSAGADGAPCGPGRAPLRRRRRRLRALCLAQAARPPPLRASPRGSGGRGTPATALASRTIPRRASQSVWAKAGGPRSPPQKVIRHRPQKPRLGRAGEASAKPRDARRSHLLRPGGCDTTAGSGCERPPCPRPAPRAAFPGGIAGSCCPVLCGGGSRSSAAGRPHKARKATWLPRRRGVMPAKYF